MLSMSLTSYSLCIIDTMLFLCLPYRIYNVAEEDAGRYICTATNEAGITRDYTFLRVSGTCCPAPSCLWDGAYKRTLAVNR